MFIIILDSVCLLLVLYCPGLDWEFGLWSLAPRRAFSLARLYSILVGSGTLYSITQ